MAGRKETILDAATDDTSASSLVLAMSLHRCTALHCNAGQTAWLQCDAMTPPRTSRRNLLTANVSFRFASSRAALPEGSRGFVSRGLSGEGGMKRSSVTTVLINQRTESPVVARQCNRSGERQDKKCQTRTWQEGCSYMPPGRSLGFVGARAMHNATCAFGVNGQGARSPGQSLAAALLAGRSSLVACLIGEQSFFLTVTDVGSGRMAVGKMCRSRILTGGYRGGLIGMNLP
jgi:hypothetical protein